MCGGEKKKKVVYMQFLHMINVCDTPPGRRALACISESCSVAASTGGKTWGKAGTKKQSGVLETELLSQNMI